MGEGFSSQREKDREGAAKPSGVGLVRLSAWPALHVLRHLASQRPFSSSTLFLHMSQHAIRDEFGESSKISMD